MRGYSEAVKADVRRRMSPPQRQRVARISEKLGIGKESVKTHLSLAIKSIKNHIETKITLIILLIDFISKKSD